LISAVVKDDCTGAFVEDWVGVDSIGLGCPGTSDLFNAPLANDCFRGVLPVVAAGTLSAGTFFVGSTAAVAAAPLAVPASLEADGARLLSRLSRVWVMEGFSALTGSGFFSSAADGW